MIRDSIVLLMFIVEAIHRISRTEFLMAVVIFHQGLHLRDDFSNLYKVSKNPKDNIQILTSKNPSSRVGTPKSLIPAEGMLGPEVACLFCCWTFLRFLFIFGLCF